MASLAAAAAPFTGEQAEAIAALRTRLGAVLPPLGRSDGTLLRFLVARDWNLDDAETMLRDHVAWRATRFPIPRSYWSQDPTFLAGAIFPHGRDRAGRPILVVRSGKFCPNERDIEACTAAAVVQIVEMFRRSEGEHTRITIVYDRQGFRISEHLDKELLKIVAAVFQQNFPETLHQALLYPCGLVLRGIWAVVQFFFDQKTRQKIHMLPGPHSFQDYVSPDQLIPECGGTSDFVYDHQTFVSSYPEVCVDPWATGMGVEGECEAVDAAGDAGESKADIDDAATGHPSPILDK